MLAQANTSSPWLTMWTHPRSTIRRIVDTDPTYQVVVLGALAGIAQALDRAASRSVGDTLSLPVILLMCLIIGPIAGLIFLHVGSMLLHWTGQRLGGQASFAEVRASLSWSSVPAVYGLALWVLALALLGPDLFTSDAPRIAANPLLALPLLGFAALKFVIGGWTFLLLLFSLTEVQRFSVWRALGSLLAALLALVVPLVVITLIVALIA